MPESSQPAQISLPPEVELLKLIVDYLPFANTVTTGELLASVRLILADGPQTAGDHTVSTGTVDEERCPDCGSMPDDSFVHTVHCERVGTCGQYGPPWIDRPWHRDLGGQSQHMQEVHGD